MIFSGCNEKGAEGCMVGEEVVTDIELCNAILRRDGIFIKEECWCGKLKPRHEHIPCSGQ